MIAVFIITSCIHRPSNIAPDDVTHASFSKSLLLINKSFLLLVRVHPSSSPLFNSLPMAVWFHYRLQGMDMQIAFPTGRHSFTQAFPQYLTVSSCDRDAELHTVCMHAYQYKTGLFYMFRKKVRLYFDKKLARYLHSHKTVRDAAEMWLASLTNLETYLTVSSHMFRSSKLLL